jgi:tetratricopeptide (TPR) repeat protein
VQLGLLPVEHNFEALAQAVDLAEAEGLLHAASRAHVTLAGLFAEYGGDLRAAREHLRRAAEKSRRSGDTAQQILILISLFENSLLSGEFEEVETTRLQIHALLRDLPEPSWAEEAALQLEEWYLNFRGEWAECVRLARKRQTTARERGSDRDVANEGYVLATAMLEYVRLEGDAGAGWWEKAEAALAEAIEIYDRSVWTRGSIFARTVLGMLRVHQHRLADARRVLEEAREKAAAERAGPEEEATLLWLGGLVAAAECHWKEALEAYEAATSIFARHGLRNHSTRVLLDWAETHTARREPGDLERAQELLREAQAAYEEMGVPRYAAVAADRLQALAAGEAQGTYPR